MSDNIIDPASVVSTSIIKLCYSRHGDMAARDVIAGAFRAAIGLARSSKTDRPEWLSLVDKMWPEEATRVATCPEVAGPNHGAENEANARLIASAPEMLVLLQKAFANLDASIRGARPVYDDLKIANEMREVIAKATGES